MTDPTRDKLSVASLLSSTAVRVLMVVVAAAVAFQAVRGAVALNTERIHRLREVHGRDIAAVREVLMSIKRRIDKGDEDARCVQATLSEIQMDIRELKTLIERRKDGQP